MDSLYFNLSVDNLSSAERKEMMKNLIHFVLFFFIVACASPATVNSSSTSSSNDNIGVGTSSAVSPKVENTSIIINSSNPCAGLPAPAKWNHVVVLMFEHHDGSLGSPEMPYTTHLANQCGTSENWNDADYRVDGSTDGEYNSKPSYATLTNGLSPSEHGLVDDTYESKTKARSIFDQLNESGRSFKVYYDAEPGGCSVEFNGDYHDPLRYYTSLIALCDDHDVPITTFLNDLNTNQLPDFSMVIPSNDHNMHDDSLSDGDQWAKNFLKPFLDSAAYQKGDTALFFLWDEDIPVPNILIAPSIIPGKKVPVPAGNPISHFSALRTWEEMLGLPLLGDTGQAPSLLDFYNGK